MEPFVAENRVDGRKLIAFADKSIYSKAVIMKCLYWFGDKFHTSVSLADKSNYRIELKLANQIGEDDIDMQAYLQKLERDLIDFCLRQIVVEETRNVRDLLIAKAFANGEFYEDPPGEVSDPVGFRKEIAV